MPKQKQPTRKVIIDINPLTIIKVAFVVLMILLIVLVIREITNILLWVVTATFLAIAMNPLVARLNRLFNYQRRGLATVLSFVSIVLILGALTYLVIPSIAGSISDLSSHNWAAEYETLKNSDNFISSILRSELISGYELDRKVLDSLRSLFSGKLISNTINVALSVIAILVMTFMILLEGPRILKRLEAMVPKKRAENYSLIFDQMYRVITGYFNGQVLIALISAVISLIVMSFLGIENAIALSVIVGLFSLIPLVGATLGSVVVVILTLLSSIEAPQDPGVAETSVNFLPAAIMAVYFIVYQQIENATIQPYIQGKNSSLSPLYVFISAIIGAQIAGFWGALLAIPVVGCLKILTIYHLAHNNYYKNLKKTLLKQDENPDKQVEAKESA